MNNEFRNQTSLYGFELYSSVNGSITLQVYLWFIEIKFFNIIKHNLFFKIVSTNVCGEQTACSDYFTLYPFDTTFVILNTWNYSVINGYNKFLIAQPITVPKGSFLYLIQNTGRVAIDNTVNATYSDLTWNNVTFWTKLNYNSNWRFYLTTINSFTSYQNSFILSHVYSSIGSYNMSITFLSSNQIYQQNVIVTNCKF